MSAMTEAEAASKWCPYARDVTGQDNAMATFNRPFRHSSPALESCTCIGSACMAWRWVIKTEIYGDSITPRGARYPDLNSGYCGAFGKTE